MLLLYWPTSITLKRSIKYGILSKGELKGCAALMPRLFTEYGRNGGGGGGGGGAFKP